jgi:hypothetical protein
MSASVNRSQKLPDDGLPLHNPVSHYGVTGSMR